MHHFEKYLIGRGFECNDHSEYSRLGTIQKAYKKGDKIVYFGLQEIGFSPTLLSPLPMVKMPRFHASDYYPTEVVNRIIETYTNEGILQAMCNKVSLYL